MNKILLLIKTIILWILFGSINGFMADWQNIDQKQQFDITLNGATVLVNINFVLLDIET